MNFLNVFGSNERARKLALLGEVLLGVIAFLILWLLLAKNAGGPVSSDEIMYINHGLLNVKDSFIINRYSHVYFQKLFMEIADKPFDGVKAYWGFLVAGSAALTYAISRLVTRSSNILHAGISTLFYLSIPLLAAFSGNTAVDITAGFFLAITALLYILYFRLNSRHKALLIGMGFTFFLAFRSKETTLALLVLFVGFLFDEQGRANLKLFFSRFKYILIGILAGVVLFIILNGIFLKDPWFGLRLSEYFKFKQVYIDSNITRESKPVANWFTEYLLESIPYVFLAYILSGTKVLAKQDKSLRLPWLVPLVFITILSIIVGFSSWGVVQRHIFPVLPLICAFAPQLIETEPVNKGRDVLLLAASLLIPLGLLFIGRRVLLKLYVFGPYNYPDFLTSSIYPIAFIGLVILVFLYKKFSIRMLFLPLFVFGVLIRYPLIFNAHEFFEWQTNVKKMDQRLQIYEVFEDNFKSSRANTFLVFEDSLERLSANSKYAEFIDLYNMYFDARVTSQDVMLTNVNSFTPEMVTEGKPEFILMSGDEYESSPVKEKFSLGLTEDYDLFKSKNDRYILFDRKDQ